MYGKKLRGYFPIFVLPTLIAFTISFIVPFAMGIYLSFTEFTTVSDARWVGLQNYAAVFSENSDFLSADKVRGKEYGSEEVCSAQSSRKSES